MVKFSEIKYERPNLDEEKAKLSELVRRLQNAGDYETAKAVFLEKEREDRRLSTAQSLASIRHSIDTRDPFYYEEIKFWNVAEPEFQEYEQAWNLALLESPFRAGFSREYGELMFSNAEMDRKTFSPEIIPLLRQENDLTQAYQKLLASARIPFEGSLYTLSQFAPFKQAPDDNRRLSAWKAEGAWYKANQPELDRLYDELVRLRDEMGRRLGYDGYTTLGYYRMCRNCYGKEDVEKFRAAVQKYVVPAAVRVFRARARRLGKEYPLSFADAALEFRSGNPKPLGTPGEILANGQSFYDELSPETGAFFRAMRESELLDVLSTEGKANGGYCTFLGNYGMPFIFANFNGTRHDVEVVTHEAGHAFAAWLNRDRVPAQYLWPSLEACEVHSMSMEFFAEPWAGRFFGADSEKFLYSHLSGALAFIPYGTMVDHFQHEVYARPDMTPAQRHEVWKGLLGVYMPWLKLDGEIPFYAEGQGWQRQQHIYRNPFYYIDYCLAQAVSLQFWALIQKDPREAWNRYMAYARQGGSQTFLELLRRAGLESPFEESSLETVCRLAGERLDQWNDSSLKFAGGV